MNESEQDDAPDMERKISAEMDFLMQDVIGYSALTSLACDLARQAGEEVKRPLTQAQLARAWEVWRREANLLAPYLYSTARRRVAGV